MYYMDISYKYYYYVYFNVFSFSQTQVIQKITYFEGKEEEEYDEVILQQKKQLNTSFSFELPELSATLPLSLLSAKKDEKHSIRLDPYLLCISYRTKNRPANGEKAWKWNHSREKSEHIFFRCAICENNGLSR